MTDYQNEWNENYKNTESRHKNIYPSEMLVSWIYKKFKGMELSALDIGCGYGNNLRFLIDNGFDAHRFDFSPAVISKNNQEIVKTTHTMTLKKG